MPAGAEVLCLPPAESVTRQDGPRLCRTAHGGAEEHSSPDVCTREQRASTPEPTLAQCNLYSSSLSSPWSGFPWS